MPIKIEFQKLAKQNQKAREKEKIEHKEKPAKVLLKRVQVNAQKLHWGPTIMLIFSRKVFALSIKVNCNYYLFNNYKVILEHFEIII